MRKRYVLSFMRPELVARYCLVCVMHCMTFVAGAQKRVYAVLLSAVDSTAIPNAAIKIAGNDEVIIANDQGEFSFTLPAAGRMVSMFVTSIAVKGGIEHELTNEPVQKIYVEVRANPLADFTLVAYSAEDIVRKAVAAIPDNYADSGYVSHSSYRQYQALDGRFCNLVEAKPVVMFKIENQNNRLTSNEAFAVTRLRRSDFISEPGNPYTNNPAFLLVENPVYHLKEGLLNPDRFAHYRFEYDTTSTPDDSYMIKYRSDDYSTERHGIENYEGQFIGEAWETGTIVIDKATFAIKHTSRIAKRHKGYSYPRLNNFVHPRLLYYAEFVDGQLTADYELNRGRWYLKKISHRYTNDYFSTSLKVSSGHSVSCYYEWTSDSVSRYISEEYLGKFFNKMYMAVPAYDSIYWQANSFPFILTDSESVYNDLGRKRPLETQFAENIRIKAK